MSNMERKGRVDLKQKFSDERKKWILKWRAISKMLNKKIFF